MRFKIAGKDTEKEVEVKLVIDSKGDVDIMAGDWYIAAITRDGRLKLYSGIEEDTEHPNFQTEGVENHIKTFKV